MTFIIAITYYIRLSSVVPSQDGQRRRFVIANWSSNSNSGQKELVDLSQNFDLSSFRHQSRFVTWFALRQLLATDDLGAWWDFSDQNNEDGEYCSNK
ncbi:hypothetical protein D5086_031029 [Populus alba]|uniref:Uncharacterized protein n=1 Tax=Populus alba TaxID=43335 RepID=A0ACC4AQ44_POPAL